MNDDAQDEVVEQVASALRGTAAIRPGLLDRTLRRQARRRRARAAAAGSLLLLTALLVGIPRHAGVRRVTFAIDAPTSRRVELVGDFTSWQIDAIQLTQAADGRWRATVSLPPGRYRFAYLVDGRTWQHDPAASRISDDFGQPTSIVTVDN